MVGVKDEDKTRQQLMDEVIELRRQVSELKQYKNILDQLPICTIFYNTAEEVVYRNRATKLIDGYEDKELLGVSREEYLKRLEIKPGEILKIDKSPLTDTFHDGIYSLTETSLRTKEGIEKPVILNGSFICDEEGNILGACGCAQDMSIQVNKDKMLRLLANNARDMIFRFSLLPNENKNRIYKYSVYHQYRL